ncbi:hypothetical protein QE152_g31410 [Popillia japonica]|uniref:Uncharacterized protein n=1 Tax=Popillia japonica TaxID=7064 RepID=A0AAW1J183_POPJA
MAGFSGVLQLTDLDDFITPSQECIKPVQIEKTKTSTGSKITIQEDGSYMQVDNLGFTQKLQKVEITLADCLACSGCITSAESVLITAQSQEEMLRVFNENNIKKKKPRPQLDQKSLIQEDGSYMQVDNLGFTQKLQKVEITLADCLACSGCITSAESVLITAQSQEEMLRVFNENNIKKRNDSSDVKLVIVSVSIQPILSLSVLILFLI